LYDVATGEERLRIDRNQATGLRFTDGGKTLTGAVMGAIYRWDTATGKSLTPEAGDSIVEQILVTADGSRVITRGQDGDAHIWDAANGKHLRALDAAQSGMALSPDGRYLVWPVVDESVRFKVPQEPGSIYYGSRLRVYDIAADKRVDRFPGFKGDADDLTFTEGGRKLVTINHRDGMVLIWDFEAGKEERRFQAVPEADQKKSNRVWRTALSSDGKTLALASEAARAGGVDRLGLRDDPHFVRLWDLAGGREKHTLVGHRDRSYVRDMAFSPDGRLLVTASEQQGAVFVWETATGKRVAALPEGLPIGAAAVAFSPDGHFLATALPEGAIRVWEVATWTVQSEFKGHRDPPTALTFAPGGRLLSGSLDTTVLAWDIRPPRTAATTSLETAWIDLAKKESSEAFKSQGRFLATPSEAAKFFAAKIKPVQPSTRSRYDNYLPTSTALNSRFESLRRDP
jgi:WD40 repeat protein